MAWNDWAPNNGMTQQPIGTAQTGATTDIAGRTYNFQTGQWETPKPASTGWDVAKQTSLMQSGADYSPYQNKLMGLLNDPTTIQQTPGYQFQVDQGNQAINRSAAAKGILNSGGVLAELAKYGQGNWRIKRGFPSWTRIVKSPLPAMPLAGCANRYNNSSSCLSR